MAHPIYKDASGRRIPSVTTILKLISIGGNEGLLYWANQLGLDGKTLEDGRRTGADVGTLAHLGVEAAIRGEDYDVDALQISSEQRAMIVSCLAEWHRWCDRSRLVPIEAEVSLVSESCRYGGTLDMVCELDGHLSVLDVKTGGVYPEHLCQVRAYGQLWEECRKQPIEEYHLLRLGKSDASFHHHSYRASSQAMQTAHAVFAGARAIYDQAMSLKKLAA